MREREAIYRDIIRHTPGDEVEVFSLLEKIFAVLDAASEASGLRFTLVLNDERA
jgi:hypothetical protein